ncbi:MAG: phage regulatory CII family protein [Desulfovibrionaceae bacterium]
MLNTLTSLVQERVLDGSMGARLVAEHIGKPYSTLMRELNPFDLRAKLGAETLVQIMKTTGDAAPLERMARELGFALVPMVSFGEIMGSDGREADSHAA